MRLNTDVRHPSGKLESLIQRGYALIFAFVFIFYIGMAALPPLLIQNGYERAAGMIYRGFRFFCHQYPWRSWFIGGPQPYYPLFSAEGVVSVEEATGLELGNINTRSFYGTPEMGYKMAVCQRDVAIYTSMALFSLLFFFSGNRIRQIDWKIWLIFGIVPLGLDGGSQLLTQVVPGFAFRESTPLIRTVTGALFGFFTCWYLLPTLEKTLLERDTL